MEKHIKISIFHYKSANRPDIDGAWISRSKRCPITILVLSPTKGISIMFHLNHTDDEPSKCIYRCEKNIRLFLKGMYFYDELPKAAFDLY